MNIKIKDIIKILSIVSTIVTGIGEITKQINAYQERTKKEEVKE